MIYIVNFGSKKTEQIAVYVAELGYVCVIVKDDESELIDVAKASGIILSGAPVLLTEVDYSGYLERFAFLKTVHVPVLGICFGHQLLGLLFGASVYKGVAVREETEIVVLQPGGLFEGLGTTTLMQEDHTEGITLPADFVLLASSAAYETEAMKHAKRNVYGVQFHPEASGGNGLQVLRNFCKLV